MSVAVHMHDKEKEQRLLLCNTHQLNKPWSWSNISAVKAESEPWQRASRQLETKMLQALGHDADGQL